MENYDITAILIWLYTSGGSSTLLSVLFERWPLFLNLPSEQKEYTFTLSSIALSLTAYLVVKYVPVEVLNSIAPFFNIIVGSIIVAMFGKVVHKADKK